MMYEIDIYNRSSTLIIIEETPIAETRRVQRSLPLRIEFINNPRKSKVSNIVPLLWNFNLWWHTIIYSFN